METNVIYNEDCIKTMKRMDSRCVDLVLTSPPYNMTKRRGGDADTGRYDVYVDWKTEDEYIEWSKEIFKGFDHILKENGVVLYNFSYSIENPALPYKLVSSICENTQFQLVDTIVWKKPNGMPFAANQRRLSRNWEFVWVFSRKDETNSFNCHKGISRTGKQGQKYYNIVYNFIEARNNDGVKQKLNQAVYSTVLCDKLLSVYSKSGDVIYDPFMGIGTTAISALKNDRLYIGSEISENQVVLAKERLDSIRKESR